TVLALGVAETWAQEPVQMISHRYPALEFYAERMHEAVPGVDNASVAPERRTKRARLICAFMKGLPFYCLR
ncbi:MAG: hypothetical protein AAFY56_08765, partial [Pseudomonadota bacterium]